MARSLRLLHYCVCIGRRAVVLRDSLVGHERRRRRCAQRGRTGDEIASGYPGDRAKGQHVCREASSERSVYCPRRRSIAYPMQRTLEAGG